MPPPSFRPVDPYGGEYVLSVKRMTQSSQKYRDESLVCVRIGIDNRDGNASGALSLWRTISLAFKALFERCGDRGRQIQDGFDCARDVRASSILARLIALRLLLGR